MKGILLFGFGTLLATPCFAQVGPSGSVSHLFFEFKQLDLFPQIPGVEVNPNPISGSTFATAPPQQRVDLLAGEGDRQLQIIKGGTQSSTKGEILTIKGDVHAIYRGYDIFADEVQVNRITQVFVLKNNAELIGAGATVKAQEIIVDFKNKTYQAFASKSDLHPALVGGVLLGDVYTNGRQSKGNNRESFVAFGDVTTCSLDKPHYDVRAKSIDVRYGKRIIMHDVTIDLLGKKLFSLPFLSLPLDDRTYQNLPVFGQNPVEGYYVKTHYAIPLAGSSTLITREDYMSRLGVGLGATYMYQSLTGHPQFAGDLGLYGVTGSHTLDFQADDAVALGFGKLQFNSTYQSNDYLVAPQSKILNTRATLSIPDRFGTTNLAYNILQNNGVGFNSSQQGLSLSESQTFGRNLQVNSVATYSDMASSYNNGGSNSSVDNRSLNLSFTASDNLKSATATFNYQKTIPIGNIQNFFTGTSAVPELALTSDSGRLFGQDFGSRYPIQFKASVGEFGDPSSGGYITRDFFSYNFNRTLNLDGGKDLVTLQNQFSQGFYSDSTAQYNLGFGAGYHHQIGKDTAFDFNYNYLHPEGYTPLGIDASGKLNLASMGLSVRPLSDLLFGVQTGYDATQLENHLTPWQVVSFRTEYNIDQWLLLRGLATYDPFANSWANFRFDFSYKPGATFVGLSARYDAINHVWGSLNGYVQALKWGRSKIDLLASFNGFSGRLESEQLNLTYDLHCAEAVLQVVNNTTGFQNGLQLAFFIRLKALPFGSIFGAGTRGQPIGLGTGVGY